MASICKLIILSISFEHTPAREGWFLTYTRQDQGDEILYYPEPKSFPLPYEMPVSTFYPRKDKGDNVENARGKGKWPGSKNSSKSTSVNPSGTVTPISSSQLGTLNQEMELYNENGKASSFAAAIAASTRLKEALTTSRKFSMSSFILSVSTSEIFPWHGITLS